MIGVYIEGSINVTISNNTFEGVDCAIEEICSHCTTVTENTLIGSGTFFRSINSTDVVASGNKRFKSKENHMIPLKDAIRRAMYDK